MFCVSKGGGFSRAMIITTSILSTQHVVAARVFACGNLGSCFRSLCWSRRTDIMDGLGYAVGDVVSVDDLPRTIYFAREQILECPDDGACSRDEFELEQFLLEASKNREADWDFFDCDRRVMDNVTRNEIESMSPCLGFVSGASEDHTSVYLQFPIDIEGSGGFQFRYKIPTKCLQSAKEQDAVSLATDDWCVQPFVEQIRKNRGKYSRLLIPEEQLKFFRTVEPEDPGVMISEQKHAILCRHTQSTDELEGLHEFDHDYTPQKTFSSDESFSVGDFVSLPNANQFEEAPEQLFSRGRAEAVLGQVTAAVQVYDKSLEQTFGTEQDKCRARLSCPENEDMSPQQRRTLLTTRSPMSSSIEKFRGKLDSQAADWYLWEDFPVLSEKREVGGGMVGLITGVATGGKSLYIQFCICGNDKEEDRSDIRYEVPMRYVKKMATPLSGTEEHLRKWKVQPLKEDSFGHLEAVAELQESSPNTSTPRQHLAMWSVGGTALGQKGVNNLWNFINDVETV